MALMPFPDTRGNDSHLAPRRRELAVRILLLSFLAFSPDIIFMDRDLMEDRRDPRPCFPGS